MKKDTRVILGSIAVGFVLIKYVIPRLPSLPGMPPRIPGSHVVMSREQLAAQSQIAQR